jgi:AcrR family transcriptional regulator
MKPTSKHIADHALKLFNKHGFVNVRLQHIADAAFVSVGHLAYHFRNKDAIVDFLFEQHRIANQKILQSYRLMPLFQHVDSMLCDVYLLQETFSFLYTDLLELIRAYPSLAIKYREHTVWQGVQIALMIDFQLARGALILPNHTTTASFIANLLLHHIETWRYRQLLLTNNTFTFQQFCTDIWHQLLPFCSPLGLQELQVDESGIMS